jgi:hypothetical protein
MGGVWYGEERAKAGRVWLLEESQGKVCSGHAWSGTVG